LDSSLAPVGEPFFDHGQYLSLGDSRILQHYVHLLPRNRTTLVGLRIPGWEAK